MPVDLSALLEPTWVEATGLGRPLAFGCVPLAPADFHEHADALASFIASAAKTVDGEPDARLPTRGEIQHMQVICVLTVRSVRDLDESGHTPFRFVLDEGQEDANAGRVWIGRMPINEVAAIAGAGIAHAMKAAQRAAGFRKERTTTGDAGRDGAEIRADAEPVGAAA